MAQYTYHGPVQNITIATGQAKGDGDVLHSTFEDVSLNPDGKPIELPQDNPIVASMLDSKLLRPVETKAIAKAPPKAPKGDK